MQRFGVNWARHDPRVVGYLAKPRLRYNWQLGLWTAPGVAYGGAFRAATQADAANKSLRTYIAVDPAAGSDLTAAYPVPKIQRS